MSVVARLVRTCSRVQADDGFVYNCALLALERAVFHRKSFMQTIEHQLHTARSTSNPVDIITNSLACHIEVLIKTSREQTGV